MVSEEALDKLDRFICPFEEKVVKGEITIDSLGSYATKSISFVLYKET